MTQSDIVVHQLKQESRNSSPTNAGICKKENTKIKIREINTTKYTRDKHCVTQAGQRNCLVAAKSNSPFILFLLELLMIQVCYRRSLPCDFPYTCFHFSGCPVQGGGGGKTARSHPIPCWLDFEGVGRRRGSRERRYVVTALLSSNRFLTSTISALAQSDISFY